MIILLLGTAVTGAVTRWRPQLAMLVATAVAPLQIALGYSRLLLNLGASV